MATGDLLLIIATIIPPVFGALWTLIHFLIFKPLKEISEDLKSLKELMSEHDKRTTLLELRITQNEERIRFLENKLEHVFQGREQT